MGEINSKRFNMLSSYFVSIADLAGLTWFEIQINRQLFSGCSWQVARRKTHTPTVGPTSQVHNLIVIRSRLGVSSLNLTWWAPLFSNSKLFPFFLSWTGLTRPLWQIPASRLQARMRVWDPADGQMVSGAVKNLLSCVFKYNRIYL